ncbi:MAG: flagellar hook-basal body protein [Phycisphaerae bacterium]|nr:flagellar hook-basal body protein [Phycisphaerae bacterium]
MIYGLYQSAAGMMVNEYKQDVLSNNMANADTIGFKRDLTVFAERIPAAMARLREGETPDILSALTGGVWLGQTATDFSEGPHQFTDNPLDAALDGPGFFAVAGPDGEPQFTRDGRFMVNVAGQLVSANDGAPALGIGGGPIFANPQGGRVEFDQFGRVLQKNNVIGQLWLADFADYSRLQKAGDQRFAAVGMEPGAASARLQPRYIEGSSVQAVPNLTEMMLSSRAYQLNARMIQIQDESAARMIGFVARA